MYTVQYLAYVLTYKSEHSRKFYAPSQIILTANKNSKLQKQ